MPANKSAFKRYMIIDALLRNKMRPYPTMQDIISACEDKDVYISPESIQKDMAFMRGSAPDGFDAPIKFNRTHGGYEYTQPDYSIMKVALSEEEIMAVIESLDLMRTMGGAHFSHKFNSAMEKVLSTSMEEFDSLKKEIPVLQTMSMPASRGFENFDLIYKACQRQIPISFVHYSYRKRSFKAIILHPFLIKEFDNKWYVYGFSEAHQEIRVFGLDRMYGPLMLKLKYVTTEIKDIQPLLESTYGVFMLRGTRKAKVEILVSALATAYFSAYPIHVSQTIHKFNGGASRITFELIPTLELARLFLSQGKHLTVVKPAWFKQIYNNL